MKFLILPVKAPVKAQ